MRLKLFTAILTSLAACVFLLGGCASPPVAPGHMRLTVMDIGEADSVLIQTADAAVLVDCGDLHSGPAIIRHLKAGRVRRLDMVVLSHPHEDHIGGFCDVAEQTPVGLVLDSGYPHGSPVQKRTLECIRKEGIRYRRARAGQSIRVGKELRMQVLWPARRFLSGTESDANNNSVVLMVTHGKTRALLTGDAEQAAEERIISSGSDLKADFLKVAHQGSRDASSARFLRRVRPRFAAICVGANNSFGHPTAEALARLRGVGAQIARTDRDGDLVYESDGMTLRRIR